MHLKAAKYTPPVMPVEGRLLGTQVPLSKTSQLIDSNNNNTNNLQFMASKRFYSSSGFGKLNKEKQSNSDLVQTYDLTASNLKRYSRQLDSLSSYQTASSSLSFLISKDEKFRVSELLVINLVELSSLANEEGKWELALDRARESLETLNSLKLAHSQAKSKQNDSSQLMTTGFNLSELTLMVNSNLAAQLRVSGHYKESIELYTQICKMANLSMNSSSQQYDSKYLLYRFGLNIGNIHYELHEYQKALKYYRLTLDRLSSVGIRSLKIKLMNNIALTLMAMQQPKDTIVAWNLLLNDNLIKSDDSHTHPLVCNSNHHQFGLNLMVCLHEEKDLSSMMSIFKVLVGVDSCHHYKKVFDLSKVDEQTNDFNFTEAKNENKRTNSSSTTSSSSANYRSMNPKNGIESHTKMSKTRDELSANRKVVSQARNTIQNISELNTTQQTNQRAAAIKKQDELSADVIDQSRDKSLTRQTKISTSRVVNTTEGEFLNKNMESDQQGGSDVIKLTKLSTTAESFRQLMNTLQEDRLEMLIGKNENQITRSLIMACNLMLDLDNNARQILNRSSNSKNDNTSVMDFCMKLVCESESYNSLVCDFKANIVSGMLERKHKLAEAIAVLKGMEQQVDSSGEVDQTKSTDRHPTKRPTKLPRSAMMATNFSLLYLLQSKPKDAIEFAQRALKMNNLNVRALINLANGYYQISNLNEAESLYQQALSINPSCWEANYNLTIVNRKLIRQYDYLNSSTKLSLTKDKEYFSALVWRRMILSMIQLALIHNTSRNYTQSKAIFEDIVKNSKQAPEVFLLASSAGSDSTYSLSILQQALKEHPYHLPLAERLIALLIQEFNYDSAKLVLKNCIKNRPDQVKWYQMLAECHRRAADYIKSASIYKLAIELFPQDTSCIKALLKLLDELGLTDEKKLFELKLNRILEYKMGKRDS